MTTIALAIAAAAIALGVARGLKLPAAAVAILAGAALSFSPMALSPEIVRSGLLLSATFLIFSVGTAIDRENVVRYRSAALVITGVYLLVTAALVLVLWRMLDVDALTMAYLVLALTSSSTLVAVDLFQQREQFFEPVGRIVRATSLTQDAVVIALLSILVFVTSDATEDLAAAVRGLLGAGALALGVWMTRKWMASAVLVDSDFSEEERLLYVLALLFLFVGVCWWAGLPFVLGVFLAAFALSTFPVGGTIRSYVASFSDFFTVLFFVFLGNFVSLPSLSKLLVELALIGGVFLLRPLLLLPIMRRVGMTTRSSLEAITALANSGELALVVILVGLDAGHVPETVLPTVAAVVVVTMALAPVISSDAVVYRLTRWYPGRRRPANSPPGPSHVVLIGCGEMGQLVLERLVDTNTPVAVIDDDPGVVEQLRARGVWTIRGDGSHRDVLEHAGVDRAKLVVSTMTRKADNVRLMSRLPDKKVLVRVFARSEADELHELGATPLVEAALAADAFFDWYEQQEFS